MIKEDCLWLKTRRRSCSLVLLRRSVRCVMRSCRNSMPSLRGLRPQELRPPRRRKRKRELMVIDFCAPFRIRQTPTGFRITFYCNLTTLAVHSCEFSAGSNEQESYETAAREARPYFNRCPRCGRWVSDVAYNLDETLCILCAPRNTHS